MPTVNAAYLITLNCLLSHNYFFFPNCVYYARNNAIYNVQCKIVIQNNYLIYIYNTNLKNEVTKKYQQNL